MLRILLIIAILAMLFFGYNKLSQVDSSLNQTQSNSDSTAVQVAPAEKESTVDPKSGVKTESTPSSTASTIQSSQSTATNDSSLPLMTDEQKTAAQTHLENITEEPKQTIPALTAQHFVRGNQLIELPEGGTLSIAITPALGTQIPNPNQLNTNAKLKVGSSQTVTTTSTAATTYGVAVETFKPTQVQGSDNEQPITQTSEITHEAGTSNPTSTQTTPQISSLVQLKELINQPDENHEERFFYIHAVDTADEQGLWGIIQGGLTNTFAQGIQLPEVGNTIQAHIPEEADEVLSNRNSSFLGKLLHDKVESTYIYNYSQGLLGQNPNMIKPGQQLIIVSFTESELMSVYQHFTR